MSMPRRLSREVFERARPWNGTAEALADQLRRIILALRLNASTPTIRTIRLWHTRHLLTKPKTVDFRYRHILEALTTSILLTKGWTLAAIGEILRALEDASIETNLLGEAAGAGVSWVGSAWEEGSSANSADKHHEDRAE